MSVLLTGGAGFIGSHTAVELISAGYDVIIVDDFSNSSQEVLNRLKVIIGQEIPFYKGSILDKNFLNNVFYENDIEAVIHFAAFKAVGESVEQPLSYYQNNLTGTLTLLEVMKNYHVNHIVFSSSATVYGMNNVSPLTEDLPTSATNPYGYTKVMIEQILTDLAYADKDLSVTNLRYFNPIGAHESGLIGEAPNGIPNNLVPYISQVAVGKLKELSVFGNDYDTPDGTGVRDYIHVVDLAKGHGYSVLDLVKAFEEVNHVSVPYIIKDRRAGDIATCYADASKAKEELGWTAQKTLQDMMRDSWRWQNQNPNGYQV